MTPMEIHKKIDKNNEIIRQFISPNIFTLNNAVSTLLEENKQLQEQCPHCFVNGYCEFCYKGEEE